MEKDATKTVIKTLKAYLHEELPPNKDFFKQLDSRGLLASNSTSELAQLADQGKQDCVWKLVTYMEQFYTEEMLLRLCNFLEEYAQPARLKLVTIASKIRQEILEHKPQVPLSVLEDTLHHSAGVCDVVEVLYPVITPLKQQFSELVAKVFVVISKLKGERMEELHSYLTTLLTPSGGQGMPRHVRHAKPPIVPKPVDELKEFLRVRWDELNIKVLESIVKHLKDDKLTRMMMHYNQTLSKEDSKPLSKVPVDTVQPNVAPEETLVRVKIDRSPDQQTLGDVFSLRNLIHSLGRRIRAMFRGFLPGSTVLFFSIPTECVWSLPSCLLPSNLSLLEEWKVLFFSVKGAFTVDIKERRVIDSLDKHSLLSSLAEYKTLSEDLRLRVQYVEKDLHFKEEELRVMEREVKVLRKGKGKEIEENVSIKEEPVVKTKLSPDPDIKTEPSPDVKPEPSSKRFKTAGPDYVTYEPPLEKNAEAEKHSLLSSLAEYKTLNDDLRLRVQYVEKDLHFKEEKLREMEGEVKALRKGKGKAVTTVQKPPRNWREMKCQKTLECGRWCSSVAVQGDVICVGVKGGVLLFSKTSGAQFRELGSYQIKGKVLGVAFIDEDTIVVSADKWLRTYTTKGQLVRTFDSGKDGFNPHGLTVGPDGSIFVCDIGNHCVWVFNVDGKLLSSFGSEGSGVGQFNHPSDVCMDGERLLFISDRVNRRICVHSVEGAFIREFPTPRWPYCVAATHCNHLVVSALDSWPSATVMIMTTSGQLVHEFGGVDSPGQFTCPRGVAVDNEDCVYVCDAGNSRVQVY